MRSITTLQLAPFLQGARRSLTSRHYTTHPGPAPSVTAWIDKITSAPSCLAYDTVDPQRARHLQLTLPTRVGTTAIGLSGNGVGVGETLPNAHHLVLFQPQTPLDQLGLDGSSTEYNAPAPYLRRMWAGGTFTWNDNPDSRLIIGNEVTESTRVAKVEFKKDMLFVYQEKRYYPGRRQESKEETDDWAVKEMRTHVFRKDVNVKSETRDVSPTAKTSSPAILTLSNQFTYTPSSPLLFRFSALTYNGHKIHYDRQWTQQVEGHPDLVVHGPLTATLLVEIASNIAQDRGKALRKFEYRATSPMYVDREVRMGLVEGKDETDGGDRVELVAEQEGKVGMKANATFA